MLAYFDCFSGISGDMVLGAFIDIGVDIEWLEDTLKNIGLPGFELSVSPVLKNGIKAKKFFVDVKNDNRSRNYSAIGNLIQQSKLSLFVKEKSLDIFKKLAEAEAEIHDCPIEKVHFHEVGGVDAIVDIVGAALCMERLRIKKVISSKIPLGSGFVSCGHGILPVPAPATLSILKGVPVYGTKVAEELVTPTGAAIISSISDSFGEMPEMRIDKIGYGAGKREIQDRPNLLRIITGKEKEDRFEYLSDQAVVVETAIDDMNPEFFGFLMERLFKDGALDVLWIPVYMKKNRPGTIVQVLCHNDKKYTIADRILSETTSSGVRYYDVQRAKLPRRLISKETRFGKIQAKVFTDKNGVEIIVPEYEACKRIALENDVPIMTVYEAVKTPSKKEESKS